MFRIIISGSSLSRTFEVSGSRDFVEGYAEALLDTLVLDSGVVTQRPTSARIERDGSWVTTITC